MGNFFVKIALVAVEKTTIFYDLLFSYEIPKALEEEIEVGSFVSIPFGNGNSVRQGLVFKIKEIESFENLKFKKIIDVLQSDFVVPLNLLELIKFVHSTCVCCWFEAVKAVLPNGLFFKFKNYWKIVLNSEVNLNFEEKQMAEHLEKMSKQSLINDLIKNCLDVSKKSLIKSLKKKEFCLI